MSADLDDNDLDIVESIAHRSAADGDLHSKDILSLIAEVRRRRGEQPTFARGTLALTCAACRERLEIAERDTYRPEVGPEITRGLVIEPCSTCLSYAAMGEDL